jgi:hypothetical protein
MVQMNLTNHNGDPMKKTYIMLGFIALLLVSICCISVSQYISKGCFWWECVPKRDFHVSDWEIPISLLPTGASTGPLTRPADNMFGEIEGRFQDIYLGYRIATYEIYRFPRVKDAVFRFEQNKKGMVDRETGKVWEVPGHLTFSSSTADDWYVACGYSSQIYSCEMTARYQEYVIFFKADINNQMTFAHFEKILFYLDEQISSRLYP